jgi:acetyltransferase-like isoleucine patch superfamily enzyme
MQLPRDAFVDGDVVVRDGGTLSIGRRFAISGIPVRSHLVVAAGGRLHIGSGVRIAHGVSISAHLDVEIADDVVIGPFCIVMDVDYHEVKDRDSRGAPRPVRIGRGVRLGAGVVVLRGATIGDGARIAAHSVVSRYVPAGAFAAGVPARPDGTRRVSDVRS